MLCFQELLYLSFFRGIGRSTLNREFVPWIQHGNAVTEASCAEEQAFAAAHRWLRNIGREPASWEKTDAWYRTQEVLRWLEGQEQLTVLTVFDEAYPQKLLIMGHQRPPVLYVRGRLPAMTAGNSEEPVEKTVGRFLSASSVAVIGSRWPGAYAERHAPSFVENLIRDAAMPVVSGLARGCDRIGHEAAIRAGVPTIAVMPCGPDRIVPEVNRDLAEVILNGRGLLITEYPPGTPPEDYRYVERDRITAALSSAAVVIQGARDSGTMQTVRAALSYHRTVGCWLPEERDEFEGNRYMADTQNVYVLRDAPSVQSFTDLIRRQAVQVIEHTEQLTIITERN